MCPLFSTKIQLTGGLTVRTTEPAAGVRFCMALMDLTGLDQLTGKADYQSVAPLLSTRELEFLSTLSYAKRRREWLGGRLCAKVCVRTLATGRPPEPAGISILASPDGVPVLHGPAAGENLALSISHSRSRAVALATRAVSCGIDIQKITGQPLRVVDRFADKAERKLLRDRPVQMNEAARLTLLWSAKEAVKKSLLSDQPVIFQGIRLESLQEHEQSGCMTLRCRCEHERRISRVTATVLGEYVLAWTMAEGDHA